jgi:hypothetical protein
MAFVVPGLAAEVAQLPANGGKAGDQFSYRERALLASVKAYVDALPAGSITLAELSSGIAPSHVVKFAGKFTTVGGDASEAIAVTGVLSTDIVHVTVQTAGATPRSIVSAVPSANSIAVTLSGDPAADHILSYSVLRAAV